MKVRLSEQEWWPVWEITDAPYEDEVEVPDELVARYELALAEFNAVQAALRKIVEDMEERKG